MEKEEIMAYLAGSLDGDGSFSIIKRTACVKSENRRMPRYRPCIQLFSLSKENVDLLHQYLGGNVGSRKAQKDGWKSQVYWYCTGLKTCRISLEKIIPYLVIKKERALFLLNFIEKSIPLYQVKKISDDVVADRDRDYFEMRSLNEKRDQEPKVFIKQSNVYSKNNIDWAYIGGLIDSDGSIQISRSVKPGKASFSYECRVTIQMLSSKGIDFLYKSCGLGNIKMINLGKNSNSRQSFVYRWTITKHEELKEFFKRLIPFLIFRESQALNVLDFIQNYKQLNRYDEKSYEAQNNLREFYYEKAHEFNKYGVVKPTLIDLEAYGESYGDKAEGTSHRERLSERDHSELLLA